MTTREIPEPDAAALDHSFQRALTLYRRGEPADAQAACEDVLGVRPSHFGARHLLGIIAFQTGRVELAVAHLNQAVALRPDVAEAHNNLGTALRELGRAQDALASYDRAIALNPNHAAAHFNRGAALRTLARHQDAVASYDRAIALRPDFAEAYFNRGNLSRDLRDAEAALSDYDQAIALRPDFAEAHNNRGDAQKQLGRFEAALASFGQVIALRPDFAEAYNNRGNTLRDMERLEPALLDYDRAIALNSGFAEAHNNRGAVLSGLERPAEALASYDRAITLNAAFAEAHSNRGNALADLGRYEAALSSYRHAIALRPEYAEAHDNLGTAQAGMGQFADALGSFDRALALRPDHAETHANRGNVLRDLGRHAEAMASYATALALKPDDAGTHWNRSLCQLAMGDYDSGWRSYEWRWRSELARAKRDFPGLPWFGDAPIDNRTILVHAEQGLGDMLQFCRYVPLLAAHARVILEVPPPLRRLLSGLDGVAQIIAPGEPPPAFNAWVPLLSLPLAFRTTLPTIPAAIPYLRADPERSAIWRDRLKELPGRKVGLVWAGSPRHQQPRANQMDRRRSVTLQHYAPFAAIPGLSLISLQKGDAAAQARTPPKGMALLDWTEELDDFADTAALIEALDLVISVDTSVVHLAGALGKPVWVLNRYDQCWRWLHDRTDSPWYPTARLFRQHTPGDWAGVIRDVANALHAGE